MKFPCVFYPCCTLHICPRWILLPSSCNQYRDRICCIQIGTVLHDCQHSRMILCISCVLRKSCKGALKIHVFGMYDFHHIECNHICSCHAHKIRKPRSLCKLASVDHADKNSILLHSLYIGICPFHVRIWKLPGRFYISSFACRGYKKPRLRRPCIGT